MLLRGYMSSWCRYPSVNNSLEPKFPNDGVGSVIGTGRSNMPGIGEVFSTKPSGIIEEKNSCVETVDTA